MIKKDILIVTDILFWKMMRGNNNRISSYCNYLSLENNVDIFMLNNDEKDYSLKNCYYYDDFLSDDCENIKEEHVSALNSFIKKKLYADKKYEIVIFPYIWSDYLAKDKHDLYEYKTIVDTNDCLSKRSESFREYGVNYRRPYTLEEEKESLKGFDYIMAICDEEKLLFEEMGFSNVFTSKYFYEKPNDNLNKLGFIASNNLSSFESIKWFYKNVFKNKLDSNYYLYICGDLSKAPETRRMFLGKKNNVLYAPIFNISDFYRMVDIAINPCMFGSGLKIKNIEAISFEKPIISNKQGLQGMIEEKKYGIIEEANTVGEWLGKIKYLSNNINHSNTIHKIQGYNQKNSADKIYRELNAVVSNG